MDSEVKITQFLDDEGRITLLPRKHTVRLAVLEYLSEKFDCGRSYTERQINELCSQWHTFGDFFILRRELVDNGLLNREKDGSRYWRPLKDEESKNAQSDTGSSD